MHRELHVVNRGVGDASGSTSHHSVCSNDLWDSLVVELDDIVASCASHEEPARPDQETSDQSDGWVALNVILYEVLIVEKDQLLRLLVL